MIWTWRQFFNRPVANDISLLVSGAMRGTRESVLHFVLPFRVMIAVRFA
jgi:hypothetical protein